MATPCILCGERAEHAHHATGRPAPDGAYMDPALVVDLCRRCHVAEHSGLRRLGLDFPANGDELLAHRLVRLVAIANRCADLGHPFVVQPDPARALGALLRSAADAHRFERAR